jgi:hypothetical protein
VKRLRLIGLGARLATAGGRPAWVRLGLMACGFAIGAALLLLAASIVPGVHARDVRRDSTYGEEAGPRAKDVLRVWGMPQSFGDLDVRAGVVEPIGDAPVPPGLPRVPAPGEIFASERLATMWSSIGGQIERRVEGHLAGTIGHDGVAGPDQLSMWVGKPAGVRLPRSAAYNQRSFGGVSPAGEPLPFGALLIIMVISCAILLPIWLFVATVTRLSAATREMRLAAVRLAGGTEAQVRLIAAAEAGVAAAFGSAFGIPLFLTTRPLLASGVIGGIQMFPEDLAPPLWLVIALVVALPTLAIGMSLTTMRRIVVSPLGVTRRVRRSHSGWRWSVVLVIGLVVLAWGASQHADLKRFGDVATMLLVGGSLACIGFGLVGTATWSAWAIARRLAGSVRSVPAMLGLRRLEAEPTSVSRVVGGVALMIAMVCVVQAGLISIERSEGTPFVVPEAQVLTGDEVGIFYGSGTSSVDLQSIPGVESVRWTHRLPFGRSGTPIGIIATDGAPATLEMIRDRLAWSGADVHTLPQLQATAKLANDDYSSFRRDAMAITLFLLLVSAATLLVAMVDWLMERRRSLAVLSAVGVSATNVRRSILVQVGLPLATSIAFGVAGAIVTTILLYTAVEQPVVIPAQQLGVLVLAVIAIVGSVTALSSPWLTIVRRPELLRDA